MRMRTRGHHIMVPETSQITNFRARLLVNKPTYWYNIFLWANFIQAGKKN